MSNRTLYVITALSGGAVWIAISMISGKLEAWDSALYFPVGLPLMFVIAGIAGFLSPGKPYRWGFSVIVLQPIIMFLSAPEMGALWAAGIFMFLILAGMMTVGALVGSSIKKHFSTYTSDEKVPPPSAQ